MKLFFLIFALSLNVLAEEKQSRIQPSESELSCVKEADCVLTAVACTCDYGMFVSKDAEKAIQGRLRLVCEDYKGPVCKMRAAYLWATCENKKCVTHTAHKCDDVSDKKHRNLCRKEL